MKEKFIEKGVSCPEGGLFSQVVQNFQTYPAFLKPDGSCASQGIEKESVVWSKEEALDRGEELCSRFEGVIMEQYIQGREFTVLVYNGKGLVGERVFRNPNEIDFYTEYGEFSTLHKVADPQMEKEIEKLSLRAYEAVGGAFYGRVDIRMDEKNS